MEEEKGFNFQQHRKFTSRWFRLGKYLIYLLAVIILGTYWYQKVSEKITIESSQSNDLQEIKVFKK
jgi:hypothetical protein